MNNTRTMRRVLQLALLLALAALLATGCNALRGAPSEPEEAERDLQVAGGAPSNAITATARVVPAREATLTFMTSGQVVELLVQEGDTVQEGDVIARLDTTLLDAQIERAEAAVAVAEAQLEQVRTGAHEAQIAELENTIQASRAAASAAIAERDAIQSSGPSPADIAKAQLAAHQLYIMMEAERIHYDWVANSEARPDIYTDAEKEFLPTQEEYARDKYEIALANYQAAQAKVDAMTHRQATPGSVRAASAEAWAASAEAEAGQAQLDLLLAGPREQDIAIAEAVVSQAQAELARARMERQRAELVAPFSGTVSEIYIRNMQYVTAGEPILLLADMSSLHVQTTDLSELDVAALAPGDTVYVTFDALPGEEYEGRVTRIAPKAEDSVAANFMVTVEVANLPPVVRWGMTAFVEVPRTQ